MALISGETDVLVSDESPIADAINQTIRVGPYGEQFVIPLLDDIQVAALSGAKYRALTAPAVTPAGTAMGIQTTFSDTANIPFIIVNGASAGGKRIIMDSITVRITAVGSTTTSVEAAIEIDTTNRYSSGGTSLAIANASTDTTQASVASQCRYAAIAAAAASGNRKWLWQDLIRRGTAPAWALGDTVHFSFRGIAQPDLFSTAVPIGTPAEQKLVFPVPPAVIGPGGSLLLHIANIANATTAPSIIVQAGWIEL